MKLSRLRKGSTGSQFTRVLNLFTFNPLTNKFDMQGIAGSFAQSNRNVKQYTYLLIVDSYVPASLNTMVVVTKFAVVVICGGNIQPCPHELTIH